jgi:hypothetical protein
LFGHDSEQTSVLSFGTAGSDEDLLSVEVLGGSREL